MKDRETVSELVSLVPCGTLILSIYSFRMCVGGEIKMEVHTHANSLPVKKKKKNPLLAKLSLG